MVQSKHFYRSSFRSLPLAAGCAQPVRCAETEGLGSLAATRSKICRRPDLAWQLRRSVSRAVSVRDFARFFGELRRWFRPNIKGSGERRGTRYRKSQATAGGGL
jgi:hypothetical protein